MPRKGMRSLCFPSKSNSFNGRTFPPTPGRITFSESIMIERTMGVAELMIMKWNPDASTISKVTSLFYDNKREAMEFIKCVNDLQKAMHSMVLEDSCSEYLIRAQYLMQVAMKRLQKEFYQILSTNRAHLDPESVSARSSRASARSSLSDYDEEGTDDDIRIVGDSISEVEQVSLTAMENLRLIAECMMSAGYGKECVKIYTIIRKSIIDEGIYKLQVEQINLNQINKMDWEVQELKIKNWLNAVKIAVKTLFHGERILCDHVFSASEPMKESCFAEISKGGGILLFGFPELVSKSKKLSPDKMFRILDMYYVISNNWPEIETIFSFESTFVVRVQALTSLVRLGESIRTMLHDFESTIQKDDSKSSVPGGGIHHLTLYVMNYLSLFADYSNILVDIVTNFPFPSKFPLPESYLKSLESENAPAPALTVHIAWLILVLLCKLDGKAEHYRDVWLSYLFLANNLQHVLSKVHTSNLKYLLGDDWITEHEAKVRQYAANYERVGWGHVYSSLPENPNSVTSPEEAKMWFKRFNSNFEGAFGKQSGYIVSDAKLRDEIRVSVARNVVTAYREFYNIQRRNIGDERNVQLFVKFAPEDVENYLSGMFRGSEISGSTLPSSSASSSSNRRRSRFGRLLNGDVFD